MQNIISKLSERNRIFFDLSIIFIVSILATIPIYIYGIPGGSDMYQHFQFAQTFYNSVMNGDLYPSWATDPNYGYGDVSVRFYPPLTYYSLTLFHWIARNWFDASCLHIMFLFFVSGCGVYLWAREWFSHRAALVGAITFIFIPYHFNQIYQASIIAEFTAAAILPFCFLFITRICQKGRLIDCGGLALSFGLLILSHLPTIVMAALVFTIYTLFSLKKTNFIQTILKLSISVFCSLLMTSFYWVRMGTELNFVKHNGSTFTTDYYSYQSNFAFVYLFPFVEKITTTLSFIDLMILISLGVLIPNLLIYFINAKKEGKYPLTNLTVITLLALLMTIPLSIPIWEVFPFIQKIQFPWRWLILVSLGSAVFVSASFELVVSYFKSSQRYLSFLAIGFLLICIPYNAFRVMSHLFYYPKDYFNVVVEKFKTGPSFECWWTTWTEKSTSETAKNSLPRPELLTAKLVLNDRPFTVDSWSANQRILTLQAGQAGQADFATLYYPHWKVSVNEKPVEVTPSPTGMISFPVSEAESRIRIQFVEPPLVIASYYLSAFAWFVFLGFLFTKLFQSKKSDKSLPVS